MIWLTVIVFVLMLLALVLAHELGHFLAAKRAGCRVDEFAFGFPPRLWSWKKGGTRYSFNLLPIGGYVKIEGEDMQDENPGPDSFGSKSIPWRLVILSAGVAMNIVLAVVLLTIQAGIGVPTVVTPENERIVRDLKAFIVDVDIGSPASELGLREFDRVVLIDSISDPTIEQIQAVVNEHKGRELLIEVERQGVHKTVSVVPRVDYPPDEGSLGVVLQMTGLQKTPWWQAPWVGVKRTGQALWLIVVEIGALMQRLVVQQEVSEAVAGPIGIAIYTNEVTNLGLSYILEFAAFISINLAIINFMPIPALDGGRVLFVIMEALFGRKIPGKVEHVSHMTGFVLLILLMILITFRDVGRYF